MSKITQAMRKQIKMKNQMEANKNYLRKRNMAQSTKLFLVVLLVVLAVITFGIAVELAGAAQVSSKNLAYDASTTANVTYVMYVETAPKAITYTSPSFNLGTALTVPLSSVTAFMNKNGTYNIGVAAKDASGNLSDITTLENVPINFLAPAPVSGLKMILQ